VATIKDVSKHAGVSKSTVSRVIMGQGYVSEQKKVLVEAAITKLGYRPNTMARALRSNRSNIIGNVVVDVASPFYAQMVGGSQAACRAANKSMIICSGFADQYDESNAIMELIDRACDGLVLYVENPVREDVAGIIRSIDLPVIMIGGDQDGIGRAVIKIDNFGGAKAAIQYLLDNGHRDIVHLSGPLAFRDTRARLSGIDAAIAEAGLPKGTVHVVHGEFLEQFGYEETLTLLDSGRKFTAIFAGDDDIAAGVILALKERGVRIPEDISVMGFDDNFHARHLTPGLTTIRQPTMAIGQMAVEMLVSILKGETLPETEITIPIELVVRDSVAPI